MKALPHRRRCSREPDRAQAGRLSFVPRAAARRIPWRRHRSCDEIFRDAVTGDHEKADVSARLTDLLGHGRFSFRRSFPVGREVNQRNMKKCHTLDLLLGSWIEKEAGGAPGKLDTGALPPHPRKAMSSGGISRGPAAFPFREN